ncbi:MAG: Tol-Pal system beta propeller repeat protein TolB [Lysobacterales bacterium 69-70]|nr:Tol-Pal system beta propeller repeat protein TolB [Xanthomonadaceae bacterium]ODU36500.1 MAG: Tol-Pal system beta propeller repeat protein TolB [Xanthomonadaceae bacterium SCN 69-320]ODV17054.1 MAG: Tol-Pal system beta propeller repeat protein TolB [Xanthomonadaceae bacterium SCN 69-25]OJY96046.1 MAG: Tol-Pal system beta propeller repeat protein TolB [Xanthomonadales bacterium 69-70]
MPANFVTRFASLLLCLLGTAAWAQGQGQGQGLSSDVPTIVINTGTAAALPITVVPFAFEAAGAPSETDVSDVVRMDLARSGKFKALDKKDVVEFPSRGSDIKFPTWNLLKQAYIVVGRMTDADGGAMRVEFELYDVAKQERLLGLAITGQRSDLRGVGHQVADLIYEKITGVRGAFWTRIAYVTAAGVSPNINYALMVADSDGYNPQVLVRSREPLLSPSWSPDGKKLAYVSFERGDSAIYIQEIATGSRQVVSNKKGINGAPAFSPDGTKLALTLSYLGNPDIFIMDLGSRETKRITNHFSIDTEAQWMPDGQNLVFTSDRSGKPQLYQVSVNGGDATRLTFQGEYNAKASISYDGKQFAMAQGTGNVYRIAVLDRSKGSGTMSAISPGSVDESPSFAPNGSMLLYAATDGPRGVLYAVSADGRVRQRLVLADGDVREPSWGPFRQR